MITLVAALQNRGWVVWWDRTILPGKRWDDVIEAQLAATKCVIVVWSEQSVRSEWVQIEAEEAKQRGILAPALLDNVRIPLAFRRIQAANLVGWLGEADYPEFQELCRGVCAVTEASRESPRAASCRAARTATTDGRSVVDRRAAVKTVRRGAPGRSMRRTDGCGRPCHISPGTSATALPDAISATCACRSADS